MPRIAAATASFVGVLVLIGWTLNMPTLKSVLPNLVSMKANTALCFLLVGISLWLLQAEDLFLFEEAAGAAGTSSPGRMAPSTALNFFLLGSSLLLISTPHRFKYAQAAAMTAGLVGFLGLVGYVYGVESLYGFASYTRMAMHTAATFVLLSIGLLFAHLDRGIMAVIFDDTAGGTMARRLSPAALGVPLLGGYLRLFGQRAGLYVILAAAILWCAAMLRWLDIERKYADEKIKKLAVESQGRAAALATANKELESFSYSVSHDLRAPLRTIDGFSQVILEDYADRLDDQGKDYLSRIRQECQQMGQLIDDLITLSRVIRHEIRMEETDLSVIAKSVMGEFKNADRSREVEFTAPSCVPVRGDSGLLRAALENLLGNAWKFTGRKKDAKIEFGVTQNDGKMVYFVKDNGAGFDMTYANKLFGAFQRLHSQEEFPGTGIGLATIQRIVHRHGGRIWAEGAVDKGAAFYFTLNSKGGSDGNK